MRRILNIREADTMITTEFQKTILAQYANSEKLLSLLQGMNYTIDPRIDIDEMFVKELDLDTCDTHGLDVWGIIVAAPRTVVVIDEDFFGFRGTLMHPFNVAPFFSGQMGERSYTMSNEAYRKMIYFKAACNIVDEKLPEINRILFSFFQGREGRYNVYAMETGVMKMRVVFRMMLTPVERAIFRTYGYLLRPAGVGIEYREIPYETFGFQGSDLLPFNVGTFYNGAITNLEREIVQI